MKLPFQSKTIIFGLLEIVIGILCFVQGEIAAGSTLTGAGIMMVLLRLITKQAVSIFPVKNQ